jgi:hypothetical protein
MLRILQQTSIRGNLDNALNDKALVDSNRFTHPRGLGRYSLIATVCRYIGLLSSYMGTLSAILYVHDMYGRCWCTNSSFRTGRGTLYWMASNTIVHITELVS